MYRRSKILRFKKFWLHNPWVGVLLIFCLAAAAYTFWIATPFFVDPDSFYHLKISEMMIKKRQAVVDFPWLQFTILKDAYVDHHLLYHIFLIPFILLFGSIVGIKFATVILAASTIVLFYILLRSFHIRYAEFFALLLLFTSSFSFRIALSKAPSVGFLFLVGGFFLLARQKYKLLILLSFFYVWSYGGFMLLLILALIFSAITVADCFLKKKKMPQWREGVALLKPVLAVGVGIIAGLLIHPSFPQHLRFYWNQIIQIGLVNYQNVIGVGAEWYPTGVATLLGSLLLVNSVVLIAVVIFVVTWRRQPVLPKVALAMFIIFFFFTLKSRRYVEYYVPWGYIFAAFTLHASGMLDYAQRLITKNIRGLARDWFSRTVAITIVAYALFMIPGLAASEAGRLYRSFRSDSPVDQFASAGAWLREHSNQGDIVFHDDWDNFPALFYNVAKVRYIVGLDPTFMYNYNPDLYWQWARITKGEQTENLLEIIQGEFKARFVIIDSDHSAMRANIEQDGRFKLVYEDKEVSIFRVPRK